MNLKKFKSRQLGLVNLGLNAIIMLLFLIQGLYVLSELRESFLTQELAIDLGTANTLIIYKDKLVVDEPSIIARNRRTGEILAVGTEAQKMHGKTHEDIKTIRPLKDGVIADFEAAEQMISHFIKMINKKSAFGSPQLRMVICIPSGITAVEKRAVKESAERAGGKEVYMIPEPMAAAIGIGIDVSAPMGNMIIDIGGGTTEIAVMSLGGLVYSRSLRVAGDAMDTALVNYMRKEYNLMIGDSTAEKIKKEIGTAIPSNSNTYAVKGRDLRSGTPKEVNITEEDTAEALNDILKEMVNGIKDALENTPPELSADLVDMGLTLTGGGALLKNIDKRFSKETGLPVFIADDPLACVAIGTGKALEQEETFSTMLSEY